MNKYDGRVEFTHLVVSGESLSSILRHYQKHRYPVRRWEPIYRATQLRTGLWSDKGPPSQHDNPDLIFPGNLLVLPRSLDGYNLSISKIQELIARTRNAPSHIEAIKKEAEDYGEKLDFYSDVTLFLVSCGGTAVKSLRAAKSAVGVGAKMKLAMAHGMGKEMAHKVAEFDVKMASKLVAPEHSYDAYESAKKAPKVAQAARLSRKSYKAFNIARGAKLAVNAIGRGADLILDWISPSQIAKAITHFDREIEKAGEMERHSTELLLNTLYEKIRVLSHERDLIHH